MSGIFMRDTGFFITLELFNIIICIAIWCIARRITLRQIRLSLDDLTRDEFDIKNNQIMALKADNARLREELDTSNAKLLNVWTALGSKV